MDGGRIDVQILGGHFGELLGELVEDAVPQPPGIDQHIVLVQQCEVPVAAHRQLERVAHHPFDPHGGVHADLSGDLVRGTLAQGAAIAAALYRDLPVFEYAPRMIKMSITGRGQASKEQVASMLRTILAFHRESMVLDATDALGAALCHFYQSNKPVAAREFRNWGDFIKKNSDRIKQ